MKARILTRLRLWSAAVMIAGFSVANAQGDAGKGYDLFQTNCTACHQIDGQLIGPELRNVVSRLQEEQGLGTDWLHLWIKDNKALRESGDKYANEVFAKYNNTEMLAFTSLSDSDIDDILAYTSDPDGGQKAFEEAKKAASAANAPAKEEGGSTSTGVVAVGFVVLAALLLWILLRVNTLVNATRVNTLSEGDELNKALSFNELFQKYKPVGLAGLGIFSLVVLYSVYWGLMGIGVDKGYEPEQPI